MRVITSALESLSHASVPDWERVLFAFLLIVAGFVVLRITVRLLMRSLGRGLKGQNRELLRKFLVYTGSGLLVISVLNATGFNIGGLLGAAGVLGIAVGIASQTSLSNIISGVFLLSERFFEVGDVVRFGELTGVVYSTDLLSIKIKTFDNVLVRIPNQNLIEQSITNITRFPIRRLDFVITVPIAQSIEKSLEVLREAGSSTALVMEEPEPVAFVREQTAHGWSLLLGVWFERRNVLAVRNIVTSSIQTGFQQRGLTIQTAVIVVESGTTSMATKKFS
jgi:small-conductance mechanosensitive channel